MTQPPDPQLDAPFEPSKGITAEGLWWLMLLFAVAVVGAAVVMVMFSRGRGVASADLRIAAAMHPGDIVPLIDAGADPDEVDPITGQTALETAISVRNVESVKLLLEHGADPNLLSVTGIPPLMSPLLNYADFHSVPIIQALLDRAANPNGQDALHQTLLHRAAEVGNLPLLEQLLAAGADIDAVSDFGTALHFARRNGHTPVVDALIRAGADDTIPDPGGPAGTMTMPFTSPAMPLLPPLPGP